MSLISSGSPVRITRALAPVVVEPDRMAGAQPVRELDLRRVEVGDGDLLEEPARARQVDPAPVGERRDGQLGDLLERRRRGPSSR